VVIEMTLMLPNLSKCVCLLSSWTTLHITWVYWPDTLEYITWTTTLQTRWVELCYVITEGVLFNVSAYTFISWSWIYLTTKCIHRCLVDIPMLYYCVCVLNNHRISVYHLTCFKIPIYKIRMMLRQFTQELFYIKWVVIYLICLTLCSSEINCWYCVGCINKMGTVCCSLFTNVYI